jgi:fibronectin type 3 domain-containing protein
LAISSTHYYKVVSKNDCGASAQSDYASATTLPCPKPAAPTNVTAAGRSESSIEISWDEVETAVSYKIYRSATSTGTYTPVGNTIGKSSTSYTDEGLALASTFYYKVTAESDCEESAQSNYAFASTGCSNVLAAPTNVRAEALSATSIKISWDAVSGAGSGSDYNVYTSESQNGYYYYANGTTGAFTSITINGFAASTTYYFKVSSENDCGESELSAFVSATTQSCNSPVLPDPTGLSATALSSKSIKITWNAVNGAVYDVYRSTDRYSEYWTVNGGRDLTDNSFIDNTVSSSTTYYYAVKSINACGETSDNLGTVVEATTMCETAIPTNVNAEAKSSSSIEITWNAVGGAVSYSVYRATSQNGTYTLLEKTANNSFNDTGLSSLTTYHYKITAKTALCDDSAMSSSSFATTQ